MTRGSVRREHPRAAVAVLMTRRQNLKCRRWQHDGYGQARLNWRDLFLQTTFVGETPLSDFLLDD